MSTYEKSFGGVKEGDKPQSGIEVLVNLAGYTVFQILAFKVNKRAIRKRGGSPSEQYAFAQQMRAINAKMMLETFHLTKEDLTPALSNLIVEHIEDIEKFLKAHPNFAKYIKLG